MNLAATIEIVWKQEAGRVIAGLYRLTGDVGTAEELAQEALVAALESWPDAGIPQNPGAWLMTTAKRRGLDRIRHQQRVARKHAELEQVREEWTREERDVGDDLLRLVFIACHPVLSAEAQVALTLRLLGGLTTEEIARAFLTSEPTIAQRIVRAKRTLAEAKVPFELPDADALVDRAAAVLRVVYLIYNEGYAATVGDDWLRPALCDEALRLGRVLARLLPEEPEVHGLVALMELQSSRTRARTGADGAPVLLLDQDRRRWDRVQITRGLTALARAELLGSPGPYALQAAIAACHARAARAEDTDWARIVALYGELARVSPSPVVELNRAVAVGMAEGPAAGLALVDALVGEPALRGYHLLYGVRADLLLKLGRVAEARVELERAAELARNARERELLRERARGLGDA